MEKSDKLNLNICCFIFFNSRFYLDNTLFTKELGSVQQSFNEFFQEWKIFVKTVRKEIFKYKYMEDISLLAILIRSHLQMFEASVSYRFYFWGFQSLILEIN